jgi:hypothetical protein
MRGFHFLTDGLCVGTDARGGRGIFAQRPILAGETVAVWGGVVLTLDQVEALASDERHLVVQIDETFFLTTPEETADGADFINHSCAPNLGFTSPITLVALRDIAPEEELSFDYAMTDATPTLEMDCDCRTPACRGRVRSDDWRDPRLQVAYAGRFSPYLQRRIDRIALESTNGSTNGGQNGHTVQPFGAAASASAI